MQRNAYQVSGLLFVTTVLGIFSFAIALAYHNIADGDLWARLAQGASVWKTGHLIHKDMFAFTPVLPEYIDHEWGSGLIFYTILKFFGPSALLFLKIITALAAMIIALFVGRLYSARWQSLLLLAIPCAVAIFPGYTPVIRSHAFTYIFFGVTIFCLEKIRMGRAWPAQAIMVCTMLIWCNVHGGFVSGLGVIFVYLVSAFITRDNRRPMAIAAMSAIAVTFVNPYGWKLWGYLLPALALARKHITEWQGMPLVGFDPFFGFRILFVLAIIALVLGFDAGKNKRSLPGILILILTEYMAFRHRRHAPFFGLASACYLGPYIEAVFKKYSAGLQRVFYIVKNPAPVLFGLYAAMAFFIATVILPRTTFQVLAPVGIYPVREADILMYSKAEGNLIVPLRWGNYAMWRLYQRIKISICGRYETVYPETTFEMNQDFFSKSGKDWDRILRQHKVDYIMLETRNTALTQDDLNKLNFDIVWAGEYSALFARRDHAAGLLTYVRNLPARTIEPLDPNIPDAWWPRRRE